MRVSGGKLMFAFVCFLLSFVLYFLYFVATVVVAGITEIDQFVGIAIAYFLVAILFLCISICFLLTSPLDLVRILLQFLPLLGA